MFPASTPLLSSISEKRMTQPAIYLRSALNANADPALATALAAFSPDIIPLDQVQATPGQLASAYNDFVAHAIDLDEPTTSVYIRGKQTSVPQAPASRLSFFSMLSSSKENNKTVASIRAVPNELILWPQVWETANIIGHTELDYSGNKQVVVGSTPIQYTPIPIEEGHSHATLIATCTAPNAAFTAPTVKNWRDLVEHVGKNPALAFYNVQTADPTARHAQLATKFRLIENEAAYVELYFALETMGIPTTGVDASLNVVGKGPGNTPFSFAVERQPLSGVYGKNVKVPSGFEGNITLDIFNYDKHVFGNYSSISIVVYAVKASGDVLLGAEHLMFDSNPRVKTLARKYNVNLMSASQDANVSSTAPYFYLRANLSDNGVFPRSGNASASPDIQPLGTVQDPNPAVTLANFSVDVSTQRQITLVSDTSNFVYLRGHTTQPNLGKTRLFYIPGSILIHPSQYSQPSHVVFDVDDNGDPVTAYRQYSTAFPQPVIIERPFTMDNIPPPPSGDHYCLIAETLPSPELQWPHELVSNFATSAEFAAWVLSEPCVAWRNIAYVTNPNPDTQTLQTSFTIPPGYSPTDMFQFQVVANGCPIGSSFSVTSDDPAILFPQIPITTNPTIATSAFTGKSPGFTCQVTIHWFANGKAVQTGQSLTIQLIQIVPPASNLAQVAAVSSESVVTGRELTSIHVGKLYPNLIHPNEIAGGRMKIGGAIRARMVGKNMVDDVVDSVSSSTTTIPIFRGIIVGADRIIF